MDLEEDSEGFDALAASLRPLALKFEGKMSFNIADKETLQPMAAKCDVRPCNSGLVYSRARWF